MASGNNPLIPQTYRLMEDCDLRFGIKCGNCGEKIEGAFGSGIPFECPKDKDHAVNIKTAKLTERKPKSESATVWHFKYPSQDFYNQQIKFIESEEVDIASANAVLLECLTDAERYPIPQADGSTQPLVWLGKSKEERAAILSTMMIRPSHKFEVAKGIMASCCMKEEERKN